MNEKIKQLAEQAEEYIELPMPDEVYRMGEGVFRRHKVFNRERFAQLIVAECAEFADDYNSEVEGVTLGVGEAIKQHFGVEE
jgi:hypothetical protein